MTDPYLLGFYVGLATATTIEIGALLAFKFATRPPKPKRECSECHAAVDPETGFSYDKVEDLFVCPECMDVVPKRFALSNATPIIDFFGLKPRLIPREDDHISQADPLL